MLFPAPTDSYVNEMCKQIMAIVSSTVWALAEYKEVMYIVVFPPDDHHWGPRGAVMW